MSRLWRKELDDPVFPHFALVYTAGCKAGFGAQRTFQQREIPYTMKSAALAAAFSAALLGLAAGASVCEKDSDCPPTGNPCLATKCFEKPNQCAYVQVIASIICRVEYIDVPGPLRCM